MLGLPSEQSDSGTGDRGQTSRDLLTIWEKVKSTFVKLFHEGEEECYDCTREEIEERRRDKASAWYAVAYGMSLGVTQISQRKDKGEEGEREEENDDVLAVRGIEKERYRGKDNGIAREKEKKNEREKEKLKEGTHPVFRDRRFLAFGWLMSSILQEIPDQVQGLLAPPRPSFLLYFGQQLVEQWELHCRLLAVTILKKMTSFKKLQNALGPRSISLFGSVAQFLCDDDSDIDVYIAMTSGQHTAPQRPCVGYGADTFVCVDPTQKRHLSLKADSGVEVAEEPCSDILSGCNSDYSRGSGEMLLLGQGDGDGDGEAHGENETEGEREREGEDEREGEREGEDEGQGEGERVVATCVDRSPTIPLQSDRRSIKESVYLNSVILPLAENVSENKIDRALPSSSVPILR